MYEKLTVGSGSISTMINKFCAANPEEFTADEKKTYLMSVPKFASEQVKNSYIQFNKDFAAKFLDLGYTIISETNSMIDSENTSEGPIDFSKVMYHW